MAIYSLSLNTTVTTITAPAWDIKAASANSPKLMEIGVNLGAATPSRYGLGRPGNDGSVVQTGTTAVQAENPADPAGQTTAALTWTTPATVPGTFARQVWLPGTIGAGIIWTFPRGYTMPVNKGVCLWNITANSANTTVWVVLDE